jgi:Ca2+-binding EF-hand superfamily protein
MRKLGTMVLILIGAVIILGNNYTLAEGPNRHNCAKAKFDAIDTNNDGKISHDEHMAKCEKRFKAMDANNDGFVSNEEAQEAWRARKEKMREKRKERRSHRQPGILAPETDSSETKGSPD